MQYNGGKASVAKDLAAIINSFKPKVYWEPFVGAANVIVRVEAERRIGTDSEEGIIHYLKAVRDGWVPPERVTESDYAVARNRWKAGERDMYLAFVAYGCSFGGKLWGGYARSGRRNYALNASNSADEQRPLFQDLEFYVSDYRQTAYMFDADVIYCDPPYKGTTRVGDGAKFDHDEFWRWCREQAKSAVVLVTEFNAPDFATELWSKPIRDGLNRKGKTPMVERLFRVNP